jgi:hypothetical protein
VSEGGRRDKDCGSRGEFYHQFHIPQYDMSPPLWVKVAKSCDGAPPERQVCRVSVLIGNGSWPQIERRGGPNAIVKIWTGKTWHRLVKSGKMRRIIIVKPWGPCAESAY